MVKVMSGGHHRGRTGERKGLHGFPRTRGDRPWTLDIVTEGILLYELNGNTRNGTARHTLVQPKPPTPQAAYERAKKYFDH